MVTRRLLGRFVRFLTGWTVEGEKPDATHYVMIAAPHTSNWDLFYLLSLAWSKGVPVSWLGKHQLFRWPVAGILKALGGVPVRRDRRNDLVAQVAELFAERNELVVVVAPEGTRRRVEFWKSGFYRIAAAADVPIYFGYLDFAQRVGGFGNSIKPTGEVREDMDVIRDFYSDKLGKHPEWFGPVCLKEESPAVE